MQIHLTHCVMFVYDLFDNNYMKLASTHSSENLLNPAYYNKLEIALALKICAAWCRFFERAKLPLAFNLAIPVEKLRLVM